MRHLKNIFDGMALVIGSLGMARSYRVDIPEEFRSLNFRTDRQNLRSDVVIMTSDMRKAASKVSVTYLATRYKYSGK